MRDLARAAIAEVADSDAHIGPLLAVDTIDEVTVVRFASLHPGYPGWHWSAALVGDESHATVNEVWMEPGEGALTVPEWKPWSERVRPGDLGAGDIVPTAPDDPRLMPGYAHLEDLDEDLPGQWELGLGRERVLSEEGVADAIDRWQRGDDGPASQIARLADHQCSTCAWLLPIGGRIGQAFGVCAHDLSPSDGHVVALDHGCGAHSAVEVEPTPVPVTEMLVDDHEYVSVDRGASAPADAVATPDDVLDADEADADAGPGDIAPPEDAPSLEEAPEQG